MLQEGGGVRLCINRISLAIVCHVVVLLLVFVQFNTHTHTTFRTAGIQIVVFICKQKKKEWKKWKTIEIKVIFYNNFALRFCLETIFAYSLLQGQVKQ